MQCCIFLCRKVPRNAKGTSGLKAMQCTILSDLIELNNAKMLHAQKCFKRLFFKCLNEMFRNKNNVLKVTFTLVHSHLITFMQT